MIKKLLITVLLATACVFARSQNRLFLQYQENPLRQKNIKPKWQYTVIMKDTVFYGYHLVKLERDELTIADHQFGHELHVMVSDIKTLKKHSKSGVFNVVAYAGMIMLSITPVVWATEGGDEALGTLKAAGGLLAISIPFIFVMKLGSKKDLTSKWKLATQ